MPELEVHLSSQEIEQNIADRKRSFISSLHRHIDLDDPQRSQLAVMEQFRFWQQDSATLYKRAANYQYLKPVSETISDLTLLDLAEFSRQEVYQLQADVEEKPLGIEEYIKTIEELWHWRRLAAAITSASEL